MSDNELIARFMGCEPCDVMIKSIGIVKGFECDDFKLPIEELEYHKSWDWLMPVVERIEKMGYYTNIFKDEDGHQACILHPHPSYNRSASSVIVGNILAWSNASKLQVTYNAVLQFIRWYKNSNPTQP